MEIIVFEYSIYVHTYLTHKKETINDKIKGKETAQNFQSDN